MKKTISLAFLMLLWLMVLASGCVPAKTPVPTDFLFILDARSSGAEHVNIQINANGKGQYERYDSGGVIERNENGMVVYDSDQVIEKGNFTLNHEQLTQLWQAINQNNLFQLTDDYRMAIGYSYAHITLHANEQRYRVDNIGMEVPEIRAIVEKTNSILPVGVALDYGEGFSP